jgi:hypothetical protein
MKKIFVSFPSLAILAFFCVHAGAWSHGNRYGGSSEHSYGSSSHESAWGGSYLMGATYATIPAGCITPNVQGTTYYLCGNTWFQPSCGANGVYYRVVQAP